MHLPRYRLDGGPTGSVFVSAILEVHIHCNRPVGQIGGINRIKVPHHPYLTPAERRDSPLRAAVLAVGGMGLSPSVQPGEQPLDRILDVFLESLPPTPSYPHSRLSADHDPVSDMLFRR